MKKISIHTRQSEASLVEKSVDGVKHRYVCGIASGTRIDQHGERLTQHCIDSIVKQCNEGDILLYADVHGVKASEDIGILTDFHLDERGDWIVEFRLYDESDKVDTMNFIFLLKSSFNMKKTDIFTITLLILLSACIFLSSDIATAAGRNSSNSKSDQPHSHSHGGKYHLQTRDTPV